tara:strand:+ start:7726 stop:8139 length:414 start_codon:yes stop_codon:yes gene_type:complete
MNDIIDEIKQIINWYKGLPMDYTGISELMYQRIQLVTLMSYYSSELGDYRIQWKNCEAETENVRRCKVKQTLDDGYPLSKAQAYGKFHSIDQYIAEKRFDGAYNQMKFFYDATNSIIDTMNQHISNLKREQDQSRVL